jgi:hypothetical protein
MSVCTRVCVCVCARVCEWCGVYVCAFFTYACVCVCVCVIFKIFSNLDLKTSIFYYISEPCLCNPVCVCV